MIITFLLFFPVGRLMPEHFMHISTLETERLFLRPISKHDIDFVYELFKRPETNKYSQYPNLASKKEAEKLYEEFMKPGNPSRFRLIIELKEKEVPIGTIGLHDYSFKHKRAEIGYDLFHEYWGNGFTTEAMKEIVRYSFTDIGLRRLEATVDPENHASIRILTKTNFRYEGRLRKKFFYKGSWHDELLYSIIREDFE
jgi:ribosomal-protein-alanine N-acetyltransferase